MKKQRESVKFVIVGDGPLRASLQNEHPDLIFRGTQTGEHLARHYASADMFLFPSETETFGNVTLEAMASGLVVVAYNYAAAKLHIKHHETGVLVPYGDSKAFVDSLGLAGVGFSGYAIASGSEAREYVSSIKWSRVVERFEMLVTGTQRAIVRWDRFVLRRLGNDDDTAWIGSRRERRGLARLRRMCCGRFFSSFDAVSGYQRSHYQLA